MTVVKFRQQSPFFHLPPPPMIRLTPHFHIPPLGIILAKAEAENLLYISPFQTIFKLLWGKLYMEWGDPFCSICATGAPVLVQPFSVGGCKRGAFSFKV